LFFQLNACGPTSPAASNEAKLNVKRDLMIAQLERVVRRIKPLPSKYICINCSIKDAHLSDFYSMATFQFERVFSSINEEMVITICGYHSHLPKLMKRFSICFA
jgi:hypothetical protein